MSKKVGRPSKYDPSMNHIVQSMCMLGATDKELADVLGVSEVTLNAWKKEHPDFLKSLKNGKMFADAEVAEKLYRKAVGYEYIEEVATKVKDYNANGKQIERVEVTEVRKVVPPDTTAQIFWLKNRRKQDWRDRWEHEVIGGEKPLSISVEWNDKK